MTKSITPNQIKENNKSLIYSYIYKNKNVSQQDIAYNLHLSRPTVTTNLNSMEKSGLIKKSGQIDSEYVGRKPTAYSIVSDFRISIGVEIMRKEIKIIAVDLYGEKIALNTFELKYENTELYFQKICYKILEFIRTVNISDEQVLGVGFAMQALISPDNKMVTYGEILSCTGLSITEFSKYLPYPCSFVHDANSAAISELWISPELKNAFYLSISNHLGAAIISNDEILAGKHGHSATIEHIQIEPNGSLCYCGKKGCIETVCSLNALLNDGESLDYFFKNVRNNDLEFVNRWIIFLTNLAKTINMLHLVYDTDFILGGHIALYINEEDIAFIHKKIGEMTPFEEDNDFILLSKMPENNIAIGGAISYIQDFLNNVSNF